MNVGRNGRNSTEKCVKLRPRTAADVNFIGGRRRAGTKNVRARCRRSPVAVSPNALCRLQLTQCRTSISLRSALIRLRYTLHSARLFLAPRASQRRVLRQDGEVDDAVIVAVDDAVEVQVAVGVPVGVAHEDV